MNPSPIVDVVRVFPRFTEWVGVIFPRSFKYIALGIIFTINPKDYNFHTDGVLFINLIKYFDLKLFLDRISVVLSAIVVSDI